MVELDEPAESIVDEKCTKGTDAGKDGLVATIKQVQTIVITWLSLSCSQSYATC
jgi:hypothetical protein